MPDRQHPGPAAPPRRSRRILDLIAAFKFVKAVTLVVAGLAGLGLLDSRVSHWATDWLDHLALTHGSGLIASAAERAIPLVDGTDTHHLIVLAVGAFAYAVVFLVEGVGLIRERRWAEYLTIAVTCSFLPFEGVALAHRLSAPRALTLAMNLAVVVYLVWRVRGDRRAERASVLAG